MWIWGVRSYEFQELNVKTTIKLAQMFKSHIGVRFNIQIEYKLIDFSTFLFLLIYVFTSLDNLSKKTSRD